MSTEIVAVETGVARLSLPRTLRLGALVVEEREYAAVRIICADGVVGKAYCLTRNAPVCECVDRLLTPLLVGTTAEQIEQTWERLFRGTATVGRSGLVVRALGLIDVALWDASACRAQKPLWRYLHDKHREPQAMLVGAYPDQVQTPEALATALIEATKEDFGLVKTARDPDPERMRRVLRVLEASLDSKRVVVDCGFGFRDANTAAEEITSWAAPELAWVEDPLLPEDSAGYAAIREHIAHPIGAGDEVSDLRTYESLLDRLALDVARVDVLAIGGITAARTAINLFSRRPLPVSFHVYPEISVHLAGLTPASAIVECFDSTFEDGNPFDPAHLLVDPLLTIRAGTARLPDGPGLGFELDWERFGLAARPAVLA